MSRKKVVNSMSIPTPFIQSHMLDNIHREYIFYLSSLVSRGICFKSTNIMIQQKPGTHH